MLHHNMLPDFFIYYYQAFKITKKKGEVENVFDLKTSNEKSS
jgi:hypothetical protein